MCGIIGIVSNKSVSSSIIGALKKLEYRGYDSAGISTISRGEINEKKCSGRVDKLEKILFQNPSDGDLGIGHVRWATHGIPNQINAHPHSSEVVSVVHNGIIENSTILKKFLIKKGHQFKNKNTSDDNFKYESKYKPRDFWWYFWRAVVVFWVLMFLNGILFYILLCLGL